MYSPSSLCTCASPINSSLRGQGHWEGASLLRFHKANTLVCIPSKFNDLYSPSFPEHVYVTLSFLMGLKTNLSFPRCQPLPMTSAFFHRPINEPSPKTLMAKKNILSWAVLAHTFNARTPGGKGRWISKNLRTTWFIEQSPGELGLHRETLSLKSKKSKKKKKA